MLRTYVRGDSERIEFIRAHTPVGQTPDFHQLARRAVDLGVTRDDLSNYERYLTNSWRRHKQQEFRKRLAIEHPVMKAIALWNPFATLVAMGRKRYETRSFFTNYRGPLAIHATRQFAQFNQDLCDVWPFSKYIADASKLVCGAILCVVELTDVKPTEVMVPILDKTPEGMEELHFGDYTHGRWAWKLENLRPLNTPVVCKGQRTLWNLDEQTKTLIREALQSR